MRVSPFSRERTVLTAGETSGTGRRALTVLGLLFLFQTLNFFDKLVYGLSAIPIMTEFGLNSEQFGFIGSLFFVLFSISGTLVGLFLVGRVPAKWILVALAVVWSFAQTLGAFASSAGMLMVSRILLGVGEGPGLPTALYVCHNWFPLHRRGMSGAVVLQGISVGFLLGAPVLTYVITQSGWRAAFLTCALLGIVWALAWTFLGGEGPFVSREAATRRDAAAASVPTVSNRVLWFDPTIVGIIVVSFMAYWVIGMSATWLPLYLQRGCGFSPTEAGWIISGIYLFQSPLLLSGAWLGERLRSGGPADQSSLAAATTVALMISCFAMAGSTVSTGWIRLVLIAIAFTAPSLTTVYCPVILSAIVPSLQKGRVMVTIYSASAVSGLASTYVTGLLVNLSGQNTALGFMHAMLLAAGALGIGAVASIAIISPERTQARFTRSFSGSTVRNARAEGPRPGAEPPAGRVA